METAGSPEQMKILVVGPSWVGDMVMAQSLFITLRQRHPGCEIHVLAPAWSSELLAHMPEVGRAIHMPVGHGELNLRKRKTVAGELKREHYDQAIILPNSFKSALIPWMAKIPLRTGWRGEARSWLINDCRVLDKQAYPLMVQRFTALACPKGEAPPAESPRPSLSVDESTVRALMERLGLDPSRPVLVLCPGAEFGEAKKWPAEGYAVVAGHWLREGGQVWIMGSKNDGRDAENIIRSLPDEFGPACMDLTGKTTLGEAIDLMSRASRVVSNDSGLMHVAAALSRPLVVVYGSTSPAFTPPLAEQVRIVSLGLDCSPCFKRTCPLGHTNCLKQLPAERVIASLRELGSP